MKTVGIIGSSGFIGSHTTKKFLQEGFKVRVSATDISKKEKYLHLKNLPNAENLEIRPLKVENKKQLKTNSKPHKRINKNAPKNFDLNQLNPTQELASLNVS